MADYAKDVLVETQWVEDHLDDDSIRIVEVDENPALYAEAHIPGAIGFDWKTDLQDQVKRDFLGPEEFGELFGSRGISNDHTVVLYGDRNNWFAAYTYWYLKYYGHDKVLLVNGPREKWITEGRPTSTDVPSYAPATFTAQPGDEAIRAMRDEVFAALDADRKLVDVRSPQEFSGELIAMAGYEQEGAQRGGPHPRRGVGAVGAGGARGRDVQVGRRAREALRRQGRPVRRADHRLLQDRRALGAHVVRAARAAGPRRRQELRRLVDGVGQPRGRPDREGRRLGGALRGRLSGRAVQPGQQVGHHPGRRAPDEVVADDVDVGAEGHASAQEPPALVAGAEVAERQLEHLLHLGRRRAPLVALAR